MTALPKAFASLRKIPRPSLQKILSRSLTYENCELGARPFWPSALHPNHAVAYDGDACRDRRRCARIRDLRRMVRNTLLDGTVFRQGAKPVTAPCFSRSASRAWSQGATLGRESRQVFRRQSATKLVEDGPVCPIEGAHPSLQKIKSPRFGAIKRPTITPEKYLSRGAAYENRECGASPLLARCAPLEPCGRLWRCEAGFQR